MLTFTKKIGKIITSRVFIVGVSILLQLFLLIYTLLFLSAGRIYCYYFLHIISAAAVLYIVSRHDNPSYKIAWIIPIMFLPIVGGAFYFMFGNRRKTKQIRERIDRYNNAKPDAGISATGCEDVLRESNPMLARQADYIRNISGFPSCSNTAAKYFPSGEEMYSAMKEELEKAEKFIMMEYFIITPGEMWNGLLEILERKAQQGVRVFLMYDDMGCLTTFPNGYDKILREKGIIASAFNPFHPRLNILMNNRDHRKICVIDGNVGFTGGINLADEYINKIDRFGHWKDTGIMLKGDAVWNLTYMFLHLWDFGNNPHQLYEQCKPTKSYPSDGFVQPFGDSPLDNVNVAETAYMQIINHAKKYVYITTPYLILDNEMLTALVNAAQSGIDVRIITPKIPDKWYVHSVTRSFYQPLLEGGVKIYEYTPGFIHSKMFVCDDEVALVGTANMDFRSFYLHFECGVSFYNSSVVHDVYTDILDTIEKSEEYTLEHCRSVGIVRQIGRMLLKVFAPLM